MVVAESLESEDKYDGVSAVTGVWMVNSSANFGSYRWIEECCKPP